jgi:hypothetical protein
MRDIWFTEELAPVHPSAEAVKSIQTLGLVTGPRLGNTTIGIVRVGTPRALEMHLR